MKIGEIAQKLGTSITTLRFYESKGLVHPKRSEKGTRLYNTETLQRFSAILELAALDIPLEDIQLLTSLRHQKPTGDEASRDVDAKLQELEQTLEDKQKRLQRNLADIQKARQSLSLCHNCNKKPNLINCSPCPDSQTLLDTQVMHIVWDEEPVHGK